MTRASSKLLIFGSAGTPLDASHVRRDIRARCQKAASRASGHSGNCGHTFISVMSESGVAVDEMARLAGCSSSRTTETICRHELRP